MKSEEKSTMQRSKKELVKRYLLCIISLFVSALGIAITKKGELGVSPISSVANILSMKFTKISLGNWLFLWNCVMIAGQVVLLRKKFQPIQLLQVPLSLLFGYFTDLGMWLISWLNPVSYITCAILVIVGTAVLGFGIALAVAADIIMNAGEAFAKALADTFHKEFGNMKICFDIFCVLSAVVLSLVFFRFRICGVREGTAFAAVFTGMMVKWYCRHLQRLENWLEA